MWGALGRVDSVDDAVDPALLAMDSVPGRATLFFLVMPAGVAFLGRAWSVEVAS